MSNFLYRIKKRLQMAIFVYQSKKKDTIISAKCTSARNVLFEGGNGVPATCFFSGQI